MQKHITLHDILQIETSRGYAYGQFSFEHPRYGQLVRVFKGIYDTPLKDFTELVEKDEQFVAFLPLKTAVNQGLIKVVGNILTPTIKSTFPTFRTGLLNPSTNRVESWSLWNGKRIWKVGVLTNKQRKYPILGIWSHPILLERIESGWTPEMDTW